MGWDADLVIMLRGNKQKSDFQNQKLSDIPGDDQSLGHDSRRSHDRVIGLIYHVKQNLKRLRDYHDNRERISKL